MRREIQISTAAAQLRDLGVAPGDILLVHASFRALRPVARGPLGVIEALGQALGPSGTLVMPSWTGDDDTPFDPATSPAAEDLGALASVFWRLPGVLRSRHAFAFAARGPAAAEILADPLPLPPHQVASPAGRLWQRDGRILLLGVDHDANTNLHLAELLAGVPYRQAKHITVRRHGRPLRIDYLENDHCCQRFKCANPWLAARGLQLEGTVGHAPAKLMRSRDLVETAVDHLQNDPVAFLHPRGTGCQDCAEAWRSVAPGG